MSSPPDPPNPQPVYRSREHALRERIRALEDELAGLRAELHGLPRARRMLWRALGAACIVGLACVVVLRARVRQAALLELTPMFSNSGWTITVRFPEPADCKGVHLTGPRHEQTLTCSSAGEPHVALFGLTFDEARDPVDLAVDYEVDGRTRTGRARFDPVAAKTEVVAKLLDVVPQWVDTENRSGTRYVYFTNLLTYGFALQGIRYGFDDEAPTRSVHYARRDRPGASNGDDLYVVPPIEARSITVAITFFDGTTRKKTFPVTQAQ